MKFLAVVTVCGMRKEMTKYRLWHDAIIERAKARMTTAENYERHHIIPRALGGSNAKSNIAKLTYREHFIVHWLLVKLTTGRDREKMSFAFCQMTHNRNGTLRAPTNWQYELAAKHRSLAGRGNKHGLGYRHTDDAKRRIREAKFGNKHSLGRKRSEEHTRKLLAVHIGSKRSEKIRYRMSAAQRGRHHTPETIAKLREANLGRVHSPETRAKMSASGRAKWQERLGHQ